MIDESDPKRDRIHQALQESGPDMEDRSAVLTGWVVVTEWIDETGGRWLAKCNAASMPPWTAQGLHHEALYGSWPTDDDGDDED